MTELVRIPSLTPSTLGRRLLASLVALSLSVLLPPAVSLAAPAASDPAAEGAEAEAPTDADADAEVEPPADLPAVEAVQAALTDGDLTTARELAVERREGDPSPDNYLLEAEVWEALGDYDNAKAALEGALEQTPEGSEDRERIEGQLEALEAESRGTRADEPESTQREALDAERAERLAALAPKPPPPPVVDDKPKKKPIVKQWYFWVTLGAIVASAGAIVGLAVSNAVDERNEDMALGRAPSRRPLIPAGGVVFRF